MNLLSGISGKLIAAGLVLLAAVLAALAVVFTVNGMIERAVEMKAAERDSHWQGEIAKVNAAVEKRKAENARLITKIQTKAAYELAAITQEQSDKARENARLPKSNKCGIDADHGRLLIR